MDNSITKNGLQQIHLMDRSFNLNCVLEELKAGVLFFSVIFIVAFSVGLYLEPSISPQTIVHLPNVKDKLSADTFQHILWTNLLVGVSLIIGFASFSIYNIFTVFINGFSVGLAFCKMVKIAGVYQTMLLILPHGIFEIGWIVGISAYSIQTSLAFYRFLNTNFEDRAFFQLLFNRTYVLFLAWIVIAATIEYLITPLVFDMFH